MLEYRPSDYFPLDADEVNFRMQHFRVFDLMRMIESGKLDILQRDDYLRRYLNLMENILLYRLEVLMKRDQ